MNAEKIVITAADAPLKSELFSVACNLVETAGYKALTVEAGDPLSQKEKELSAEKESLLSAEKCIIICAGGYRDTWADVKELSALGLSEIQARDGYGAVFFAANGPLTKKDEAPLSRWVGTPHLRVVNRDNIKDELYSYLGIPRPLEIERKFLIEMPDTGLLLKEPLCRRVHIRQTYLKITPEEEIRVRARGVGDDCLYFKTVKTAVSKTVREEREEQIDRESYERLTAEAGEESLSLEKDRYCLMYEGQYFETDVYPFSDKFAVTELELCREDAEIRFPDNIKVIREVTGEKAYKNAVLAKKQLLE